MTKLSAKIIEETLDYEDVTPKANEVIVKKVQNPKHYVGTYSESQLNSSSVNNIIASLQDEQHFPNLKYINHRVNKTGKTEVWLSEEQGQYTINKA